MLMVHYYWDTAMTMESVCQRIIILLLRIMIELVYPVAQTKVISSMVGVIEHTDPERMMLQRRFITRESKR